VKIAKSSRASPGGSTSRCIAAMTGSSEVAPMSSRSMVIVDGSTTSACRAVAVHAGSCTTKVSSRPSARRSRPRSWWWWKGLPPIQ
jgi:hypothetical protein